MRTERDGKVVFSDDPDEKTDDSAMPRTERDGQVIHDAKAVTAPPEDKAVKSAAKK